MLAFTLAAALLSGDAQAFCGHYLGTADSSSPKNEVSQIVYVREGNRTTITMANDYSGGSPTFAMIIPVPDTIDRDDIKLLDDPTVVKRVDTYAGPRLVSYTCDDLNGFGLKDAVCGCATNELKKLALRFALDNLPAAMDSLDLGYGDYNINVISPESVEELADWATGLDFTLGNDARPLLEEYISGGSSFIAVTVELDSLLSGGVWLQPIQFSYESENMGLPIRLGALNSLGRQDVIIHVITDEGSVGIANYGEFEVESNCMIYADDVDNFSDYYESALEDAYQDAGGGAGWATEYVWAPTKCDPCSDGGSLDEETLKDVGYKGDPNVASLTRLHVRYNPASVTQDLSLYTGGAVAQWQQRYIVHDVSLEEEFPVCDEGYVEGGGSCADDTAGGGGGLLVEEPPQEASALPFLPVGLVCAGLWGWMARRRPD